MYRVEEVLGLQSKDGRGLDPERARRIAEECYGEVLSYCSRHAPNGCEAEDLAQETFLRFVRAKGYAERGKPIAYLMRTARSVCVDASRKRRLETVPLDFDIAAPDADESREVWQALGKLPDELREAVEMRFGAGLEVNEVARALGISRFSARRRIDKALRLLAREIGDEGATHEPQEDRNAENNAVKKLRRA